jgi:hypothetical protein
MVEAEASGEPEEDMAHGERMEAVLTAAETEAVTAAAAHGVLGPEAEAEAAIVVGVDAVAVVVDVDAAASPCRDQMHH